MNRSAGQAVILKTSSGALRGSLSGTAAAFLGVPYAMPPVGERRFLPAARVPAWEGIRNATEFGPGAPQPGSVRAHLLQGRPGRTDENCLTLNVWTPDPDPAARLPVLVWVHGGAFTNGAGSVPALHGADLATAGRMVVVTVNYRLGALGFALHEQLAEPDELSPGLGDLLTALEWLRDNAYAFGGRPDRITLGGESAGSMCAALLSVLPSSRDLFGQLILHSGMPGVIPDDQSRQAVRALAAELGVGVPDLRGADASALIAATAAIGPAHRFGPAIPGDLTTLRAAAPPRPQLISTTADEGTFFFIDRPHPYPVREDQALAVLAGLFGPPGPAAYRNTEAGEPLRNASAVITERMFSAPAGEWASAAAGTGAAVHRALYAHPTPAWGGWLGATHTIEIPLLFGTFRRPELAALYRADPLAPAMADKLQTMWTRFVHTGLPGANWPQWTPGQLFVRRFDPRASSLP